MDATATAPDADLAAIEAVVATVGHAMAHELVDEFVGLFRHDAVATTAHGRVLAGRDEIEAFTSHVLPGSSGPHVTRYDVAGIVFVTPDVAAVKVRQRVTTADGVPVEGEDEGSPLYVMAREDDGRWALIATQNAIVLRTTDA